MSNIKNFLFKLSQGLFEYILLFPIFLMIGVYIIPEELLWIWLAMIPCLFLLGLLFRSIFYQQAWWVYALYSLLIGISSSLLFEKNMLFVIIVAMIHPIIVYRGIMYVGRSREELIQVSFLWVGGPIIYFVSFFFFHFIEMLNQYKQLLTIFGIVMLVITMFLSNSDHLKSSTLSKDKKPFISRNIKNQNRVFLIITLGLIFLIANGRMIRDGFWNMIRSIIQWLVNLGSSTEGEEIIGEEPPPADFAPPFPEEDKGPSIIAEFLELVMTYVMYVFLGFAAIILILLLIKKTREIIINAAKKLIAFLKQLGNQFNKEVEDVQYVDEKESVFNWDEWKAKQQEKVKGFMKNIFKRKQSWDTLSNDQKVRFIYKHFLSQHSLQSYHSSFTPREIIEKIQGNLEAGDEELAIKLRDAYEQVRYGEKQIEDTVIQEIYSVIQDQ